MSVHLVNELFFDTAKFLILMPTLFWVGRQLWNFANRLNGGVLNNNSSKKKRRANPIVRYVKNIHNPEFFFTILFHFMKTNNAYYTKTMNTKKFGMKILYSWSLWKEKKNPSQHAFWNCSQNKQANSFWFFYFLCSSFS